MSICVSGKSIRIGRHSCRVNSTRRYFHSSTRPKFDGVVIGCYAPSAPATGAEPSKGSITFTKDGSILDRTSNGNLQSILKLAKNEGSLGKVTMLYNNFGFDRLAVVGLGKMSKSKCLCCNNKCIKTI